MEVARRLTWNTYMCSQFYEDYFAYVGLTESPRIYHRWMAISTVAALLGRSVYFPFGHSNIYPNHYIMLVGNPGARKGTALKPAKNALKHIDFDKLGPDRISPEKFLSEMQALNGEIEIDGMDFENLNFSTPSEIYVVAEEFGDFIRGNVDFIRLLTNLWDNLPSYKHPKLHGKSVYVHEPTINIIGATTQQDMAITLPIEAIGQGFLSRFILVYGEPTGTKITFPPAVNPDRALTLEKKLKKIADEVSGKVTMHERAENLLDRIYKNYNDIDDYRFKHYNTRRFTHLIKLCTVFAAMDLSTHITPQHVLQANTLLHVTEQRMSKALGEFGKSKNSDVANNIIEYLKTAKRPMNIRDIWKRVSQDLNKLDELIELLRNLEAAERIKKMEMGGKVGFLPFFKTENKWEEDLLIQKEFLTAEEMV